MTMKKFLFAAILGLGTNAAFAQVNALPPTPHILVFGHAEARAIPDRFTINMTVSVTDLSADVARRKVQAHVEQILAGLKQAGVPNDETTATSLKIAPDEEYDSKTEKQVYKGVQVSRDIGATFDELDKLQQFLGKVAAGKELQISGITTGLRDEAKLREQLRGKAIESTQEKAKSIAQAYAAKLGGLYSVSDVAPEVSYGVKAGSWPVYDYDARNGRLLTRDFLSGTMGSGLSTSAQPAMAPPPPPTSLQTGYVTFEENIYAVFLLGDGK
jgi:uncharacterized protein YggE